MWIAFTGLIWDADSAFAVKAVMKTVSWGRMN